MFKERATNTAAFAIVGRAITIKGAIQKRSNEPMQKMDTKNKKVIQSDNFGYHKNIYMLDIRIVQNIFCNLKKLSI